ncbi:hypothetical protein [Streptomyces thermolilacinus]|uniref:Roadblock/LAMTOR2 domain-containing protein n=1 Tax=Streptomyces thermolilacinus SPC6 TaxID=1306406 RepID=A0A1D3DUF8_9ACTN|nr:hypothetical protein [Streptomyces thermolilacinus]OEJ95960.1 hypothetical protein J116_017240 [Streptomyces thermolilacinus SPC6]
MPGIDECLLEAMTLPGARGAALVDWTSGLALGTAGESPVGDHETSAAEAAELARAAAEYQSFSPAAGGRTGAPDGGPPGGAPGAGPGAVPGLGSSPGPGSADDEDAPVEDLIVTTRTGYHVLRFVTTNFDSSLFLHLWLDRDTGNLALARLRLRDLAERLVL